MRVVDGVTFIDHTIVLGRRQAIAGVEHALRGMKVGRYRNVRVAPHLAYREKGIAGSHPSGCGALGGVVAARDH